MMKLKIFIFVYKNPLKTSIIFLFVVFLVCFLRHLSVLCF